MGYEFLSEENIVSHSFPTLHHPMRCEQALRPVRVIALSRVSAAVPRRPPARWWRIPPRPRRPLKVRALPCPASEPSCNPHGQAHRRSPPFRLFLYLVFAQFQLPKLSKNMVRRAFQLELTRSDLYIHITHRNRQCRGRNRKETRRS